MAIMLMASILWGLTPARAGLSRLVINEVHPDPEGSDEGREFVEILNAGSQSEDLQEVTIEFGNGAEGPVWTVRWSGSAGTALAAGARYLVADRNWQESPPPDAQVWLGLQNGPDAVRLVRQGTVLDLVGYGALTDPAMLEGHAVPLTAGRSLARRPDGQDTGDNAADFVCAQPTPGLPNFLDWDPRISGLTLEPPCLDRPLQNLQVVATLLNAGLLPMPSGPLTLKCGDQRRQAVLDRLLPGQEASLAWVLQPQAPGRLPLSLHLPGPVVSDTLTLALGWVQVGPADLVLNEVCPAPGQGQGEWVELRNLSDRVLALQEFRLGDADGPAHLLPYGDLAGGALVVVAQDSAALWSWEAANQAAGAAGAPGTAPPEWLRQGSAWPTLNNSPPPGRSFADRVTLTDAAGTVIDQATLEQSVPGGGAALPKDRSLERIAAAPAGGRAANWAFSTAVCGSTPGRPNSLHVAGATGPGLTLDPAVLDPAGGVTTVHILFEVPALLLGCQVRLFDLYGHLVRDLGGDDLGAGPRALFWDGRDDLGGRVPAGGYVLLVEILDPQGRTATRSKACLGVR